MPLDANILASLRKLEPTLRARGVNRLAVFGSRARNDYRPDSDLDVLIDVKEGKKFSLLDLVGVSHLISDSLRLEANIFMRRSLDEEMARAIQADVIEVFDV